MRDTRIDVLRGMLVREPEHAEDLQASSTAAKLNQTAHRAVGDTMGMLVRWACNEHGLAIEDGGKAGRRLGRGGPRLARGPLQQQQQQQAVGADEVEDVGGDDDDDDMIMMDVAIQVEDGMNPEDLY
jgi:hypothetical protein